MAKIAQNGLQIMSEADQLGKMLSNSERIFHRNEIFSVQTVCMCPARAWNWGFPRVPNRSWHLPGRPSGISPATRQHIPADHDTLTQHPGNTSRHTLNIGPGTPATLPGTCSAINPARHALPTDFRHHMATMLI